MELTDEILTEISYVQMSKYRIKVMKALEEDVKIPSVIAKNSGIKINHISKILAELKAHGWLNALILKLEKAGCTD